MARIRTVKPEFWTSAQVLECSPNARLLFIGLWNFADDYGRHPDSTKQAKAEIFPADDISLSDVAAMLDDLERNGLIERYTVDSVAYFQITGWHHQRIDKRQKAKYPSLDDADSTNIPRTLPPDTIRGDTIRSDTKGDDKRGVDTTGKPDDAAIKSQVAEVIDYLNGKCGSKFKCGAANAKFIKARFSEGFTTLDLKDVIDAKHAEWSSDAKMRQFLRPSTLFNAEKFAQYHGQAHIETAEQKNRREIQEWIDGDNSGGFGQPPAGNTIEGEAIYD